MASVVKAGFTVGMGTALTVLLAGCSQAAPSNATMASEQAKRAPDGVVVREGDDYVAARARLIADGWQPFRDACTGGGTSADTCRAYPEIGNCSGTGVGHCDMQFSRGAECLAIVTVGGAPRADGGDTRIAGVRTMASACVRDSDMPRGSADASDAGAVASPNPNPRIVSRADRAAGGKAACDVTVHYASTGDQTVSWPGAACDELTIDIVRPETLAAKGALEGVAKGDRESIEAYSNGVLVIVGRSQSAAYPPNLSGEVKAIPLRP